MSATRATVKTATGSKDGPKLLTSAQSKWVAAQIDHAAKVGELQDALEQFKDPRNTLWAQFIPEHLQARSRACLVKVHSQLETLNEIHHLCLQMQPIFALPQ